MFEMVSELFREFLEVFGFRTKPFSKPFYKNYHPNACQTCAKSKYNFLTGEKQHDASCDIIDGLARDAGGLGRPGARPTPEQAQNYQRRLDNLRYNGCPGWESRADPVKTGRFARVEL